MKVLWFANTPCNSSAYLGMNSNFGGWLSELATLLDSKQEIELGIVFMYNKPKAPFVLGRTKYYPILSENRSTKLGKFLKRLKGVFIKERFNFEPFKNVIDGFRPDIIHVHGTENNFGLIQFYTKVPVVVSIQGLTNAIATKYFSGISNCLIRKYTPLKYKLALATFNTQYLDIKKKAIEETKILSKTKNIIGRTDWDYKITRLLSPKSDYYVLNEIMRSPFYEMVWDKKHSHEVYRIITTLSDNIYKGLETIYEVSEILINKCSFKFEWVVIGIDDKSQFVELIRRWKGKSNKQLNIRLFGFADASTLCKELCDSDVYCQVSHIENSPNSLCEAALLGMPIVASNVGGTESLIENNVSGLLYSPGDYYNLAATIVFLSGNVEYSKQLGTVARKEALLRHNRNAIVNELGRIYLKLSNS